MEDSLLVREGAGVEGNKDATAMSVLAGNGVPDCLSVASTAAGRGILDSSPNSGLDLCLL